MFAFVFDHSLFEFEYATPQFDPLLALPPQRRSSVLPSTFFCPTARFRSLLGLCLNLCLCYTCLLFVLFVVVSLPVSLRCLGAPPVPRTGRLRLASRARCGCRYAPVWRTLACVMPLSQLRLRSAVLRNKRGESRRSQPCSTIRGSNSSTPHRRTTQRRRNRPNGEAVL